MSVLHYIVISLVDNVNNICFRFTLCTSTSVINDLLLRFMRRPTRTYNLYDPTVVMNRANLNFYSREGFIKLGFYVVSFLLYLYK